jgi:hypothetical protein
VGATGTEEDIEIAVPRVRHDDIVVGTIGLLVV